ncbi:hypothetical protein FJY63_14090, partial [Candidatus Sumerlaeota bacterium]|nr:hypothetical protein [Candidatus Sumerlaeota bacterium]
YLWFSFSVPRLGPASGGPGYPSSAYTYSSTMTVPAVPPSPDTAPVGYRVLVQCDATSSIIEFDETNNIMEKGRFRIIFGADLVIPQGYVRRLFGMPDRNAQVSVTVSNAGDMPASSSLLALYFSDDDVLDSSDTVWASNISIPALSAGASFTYSDVLPVPPASEGTYHIIARCDAAGSVDRWSDNNTHDLGPLSLQTRVRYWPHYK